MGPCGASLLSSRGEVASPLSDHVHVHNASIAREHCLNQSGHTTPLSVPGSPPMLALPWSEAPTPPPPPDPGSPSPLALPWSKAPAPALSSTGPRQPFTTGVALGSGADALI